MNYFFKYFIETWLPRLLTFFSIMVVWSLTEPIFGIAGFLIAILVELWLIRDELK